MTFSVKVTATAAGTLIESNAGTVNGLNLNKITNTVSGISREKLNGLSDIAKELIDNETAYSDPVQMINAVYSALLGEGVIEYATVSEALEDNISADELKYNESCAMNETVMASLSGGYLIKGSNPLTNERIRDIRLEYLSVGDIIIAEHTNASNQKCYIGYVYLGDTEFISLDSTSGVCEIAIYRNDDFLALQNILTCLYSYEKYAVIRPSLNISAE